MEKLRFCVYFYQFTLSGLLCQLDKEFMCSTWSLTPSQPTTRNMSCFNVLVGSTGYSLNIVFFFLENFYNIPDSGFSVFSLGVSVCKHTRQVENQRFSRTSRVQKYHNIFRKNTILNEHLVCKKNLNYSSSRERTFHDSIPVKTLAAWTCFAIIF